MSPQLTWDDVIVTEELVTIRLGSVDIALGHPLDRALAPVGRTPRPRQDRRTSKQPLGLSWQLPRPSHPPRQPRNPAQRRLQRSAQRDLAPCRN